MSRKDSRVYYDTPTCPQGHVVRLWRRRSSAGKVVRNWCPDCRKHFHALAGPIHGRKP